MKNTKEQEQRFSKEQIGRSSTFSDNIDLLNAVLDETEFYTLEELKDIVTKLNIKGGQK